MIRWPCLCLVCWSLSQEFLKKAHTQKAGKIPIGCFAGASERLPLRGARQCNREGLGNSHAGYIHWWQRNGLHRTKNKWHSVKRKIMRYYYTYLYINCDHIAVFDLYPMAWLKLLGVECWDVQPSTHVIHVPILLIWDTLRYTTGHYTPCHHVCC